MQLEINATLKGKVDGEPAVWPKGSTFDNTREPIPEDIIAELESGSGLVKDITPVQDIKKSGGAAKKSKAAPPAASKAKAKTKVKAKAKLKAKKTTTTKAKKPAAKSKRKEI